MYPNHGHQLSLNLTTVRSLVQHIRQFPLQCKVRGPPHPDHHQHHHHHVVVVIIWGHPHFLYQKLGTSVVTVHLLVRTYHIIPIVVVQGEHQALHWIPLEGQPRDVLHDDRHVVEQNEEPGEHEHVGCRQHTHKCASLGREERWLVAV